MPDNTAIFVLCGSNSCESHESRKFWRAAIATQIPHSNTNGKSVRSFYAAQQSMGNPRETAAAAKAASMWPKPDEAATPNDAPKADDENGSKKVKADKVEPTEKKKRADATKDAAERAIKKVKKDDSAGRRPGSKSDGQRAKGAQGSKEKPARPEIANIPSPAEPPTPQTPPEQSKQSGQSKQPSHNPREQQETQAPGQIPAPAPAQPQQPTQAPKLPTIREAELTPEEEQKVKRSKLKIALGSIAAVAACSAIALAVAFAPITVTVNGNAISLSGQKTLSDAIQQAELMLTPGDFVAVDGSVLEEGAGEPFDATIDGHATTDSGTKLLNGAVVEVSDGSDIVESYTVSTESVARTATIEGVGAMHKISVDGEEGEQEIHTGDVSGIRVAAITKEPGTATCTRYNINAGEEKVIALTFDDGPSEAYTPEILDTLNANEAHATFFTIGYQIEGERANLVKRAHDEGHQICTHTWDHAGGSGQGVNLSYMSAQEQVDEVIKGYDAIKAVTGSASTVIRTPGGNFPESVVSNLSQYITYEVGWNIDTHDWERPGVAAIRSEILSATSGDIVLMHDGGGDRSQTAQALAEALPQLASQGYRFVTIDELISISESQG